MDFLTQLIARDLSLPEHHVETVLSLFADKATIPFIARYRKERTGGLDEVQLRSIDKSRQLYTDLHDRRVAIKKALEELGKLSGTLRLQLDACTRKVELEDLYAPFKSRKKSRADKAREAGLGRLAERILEQPRGGNPVTDAMGFVRSEAGIDDPEAALQGARDIVAENLALDPARRSWLRDACRRHGLVETKLNKKHPESARYRDYEAYSEAASRIPSHRYLAVCRGEKEGALRVKLRPDMDRALENLARELVRFPSTPYGRELVMAAEDSLMRLLMPTAERATRAELKIASDSEAIDVFARNLEALLLAAPLGAVGVLGVDPGIRTGCKWAMVSSDGALARHGVVHVRGQSASENGRDSAWRTVIEQNRPSAVAVGNGTGGREAESIIRATVESMDLDCIVVSVNEAGASIYSATELAGRELGQVDLTVRGAVSIARRLQDPLAELVKIPPKSIGVGQYQHDVDQAQLQQRLEQVVASCVNRVGVDVTTASPALLAHVAGLGPRIAEAIVLHRQSSSGLKRRRDLLEVAGLGAKTFEQCAGFLRVSGSPDPLDTSAVHPERYELVGRMAKDLGVPIADLVGNAERVAKIDVGLYVDRNTGRSTLDDIVAELAKPGRDPRTTFESSEFRTDVLEIADLELGMVLHGVVTNVTNFGAFVDIGVHHDGLVHVSQLSDNFVRSPHDVVQAGQALRVKVLEVDRERSRIGLTSKPSMIE